MLYHDRIAIYKGTDVNKTSESKEGDICHYWCFLNKCFKFQPNGCTRCYHLLMSTNLSDMSTLNIKGSDYYHIISRISKNEVIYLMQNAGLTKKPAHFKT